LTRKRTVLDPLIVERAHVVYERDEKSDALL
jgi:hypothetical protein